MKTCPKCKARNLNSSKNCENCGTSLESIESGVSLQNEDKSIELTDSNFESEALNSDIPVMLHPSSEKTFPEFQECSTRDPSEALNILLNQALKNIPCLSQEEILNLYQLLETTWKSAKLFTNDIERMKDVLLKNFNSLSSNQGFEKFVINVLTIRQCVQIKALFSTEMFAGLRIWRTDTAIYGCGNSAFHAKVEEGEDEAKAVFTPKGSIEARPNAVSQDTPVSVTSEISKKMVDKEQRDTVPTDRKGESYSGEMSTEPTEGTPQLDHTYPKVRIQVYKRTSELDENAKVEEGQEINDESLPVKVRGIEVEMLPSYKFTETFQCPWCNKFYKLDVGSPSLVFRCVKCEKQMLVIVRKDTSLMVSNGKIPKKISNGYREVEKPQDDHVTETTDKKLDTSMTSVEFDIKSRKEEGNNRRIELTDSNFQEEVLNSDIPVMVHFSGESELDSEVISIIDGFYPQYSSNFKFGKIVVLQNVSTTGKYGIAATPTLLIFKNGKAVVQIIGTVPKETITSKLDMILDTPSEKLHELSLQELKNAYKPIRPIRSISPWQDALISGLFSGIIAAIAVHYFENIFVVFGGCYLLLIRSLKSIGQQLIAILIMVLIGLYGEDILLSMHMENGDSMPPKETVVENSPIKTEAPTFQSSVSCEKNDLINESNLLKYANNEYQLSFKYPIFWKIMTPEEVTEQTKGLWTQENAIVVVVNKRDPNKNVIIGAFEAPKSSITPGELRELEKEWMDQEYPKRFSGFKKVSSRICSTCGVEALEYVMEHLELRTNTRLRQKQLHIVKDGTIHVLTFTSPKESFDNADKECFQVIISTLKIKSEPTSEPERALETAQEKEISQAEQQAKERVEEVKETPEEKVEEVSTQKTEDSVVKTPIVSETLSKEVILRLQERLTDLGYNPGPIDGIWGKKTETALKKFQEDNSLPVTGKLDEATKEKLDL